LLLLGWWDGEMLMQKDGSFSYLLLFLVFRFLCFWGIFYFLFFKYSFVVIGKPRRDQQEGRSGETG